MNPTRFSVVTIALAAFATLTHSVTVWAFPNGTLLIGGGGETGVPPSSTSPSLAAFAVTHEGARRTGSLGEDLELRHGAAIERANVVHVFGARSATGARMGARIVRHGPGGRRLVQRVSSAPSVRLRIEAPFDPREWIEVVVFTR